jgi:hypothetical protein
MESEEYMNRKQREAEKKERLVYSSSQGIVRELDQ